MERDPKDYSMESQAGQSFGDRLYSVFGVIVSLYQRLRTFIYINGAPLDTWLLVVLPLICLFAWAEAATSNSPAAWIVFASSGIVSVVLAICRFQHGIVFRTVPETEVKRDVHQCSTDAMAFFASGRFALWRGDRTPWQRRLDYLMSGTRGDQWFLQAPAIFNRISPDVFAITAFLDASLTLMGVRLEDKAGRWEIQGVFASLKEPEAGIMYFGLNSRPALRLRFQTPTGRNRSVVLSFEGMDARCAFAGLLKSRINSSQEH